MKEQSLFDFPTFETNKKIRLIELFGGIGSQAMALRDIGADFEHYRLVEFDKYAVNSYNAIHNSQFMTSDIRDIHAKDLGITDKEKFCYIMTYSFPCTDLSVAGKMQGMSKEDWENGNATRSGLLWEVERILKECKKEELPDILLMENVSQVHADANKIDFDNWLQFLRGKGYHNFWEDLNAKDFGIPQNRERCFCVSILSDDFIDFEFPEITELQYVMKDFLEEKVDERYYIKNEKAESLIKGYEENIKKYSEKKEIPSLLNYKRIENIDTEIAMTVTAREYKGFGTGRDCQNGVIEIKQNTKEGYIKCKVGGCFDASFPESTTRRGRVQGNGDLVPTVTVAGAESLFAVETKYKIRRLTPKECWRIMGYKDTDFEKASKVVSNTQLYKQAGNAIVKQVLMAIFLQMNLQGLKKWDDRTEEEKQDLIIKSVDKY